VLFFGHVLLFFCLFIVTPSPRKFFCRRPCLGTRLFIKVPRPGDREVRIFSVFESNCHLFLPSIHSKVVAIQFSALPKNTSELAGLSLHYPSFMLNVKQESCEYQLLKSFGLTQPGNRFKGLQAYFSVENMNYLVIKLHIGIWIVKSRGAKPPEWWGCPPPL